MKGKVAGFVFIVLTVSFLCSCHGFFQPDDTNNNGGGGGATTAKFAYVASSQTGSITGFTIASNGQLSKMSASPFTTGIQQGSGLAVTPTGDFLFATDRIQANLFSFPIDRNTGSLQSANPSLTSNLAPVDIAVSQDGAFAYGLNQGVPTGRTQVGDVDIFDISTQGLLTLKGGLQQAVGLNPHTVRIDASGKFLYVAGDASGTWAFAIQTLAPAGSLIKVGQVATTTGTVSSDIALDPATKFAWVANGSSGVETYAIGTDGNITRTGGVTAAGTTPTRLAVTPNGKFLYVVNQGSNNVSAYSITSGTLTSLGTIGAGSQPNAIAIDPSSAFVYVTNFTDSTISVYSIGSTGALTSIQTINNGISGPSGIVLTK